MFEISQGRLPELNVSLKLSKTRGGHIVYLCVYLHPVFFIILITVYFLFFKYVCICIKGEQNSKLA